RTLLSRKVRRVTNSETVISAARSCLTGGLGSFAGGSLGAGGGSCSFAGAGSGSLGACCACSAADSAARSATPASWYAPLLGGICQGGGAVAVCVGGW